jgi:prepilin-type N-terminal cleavage/methylation domain-containing protein
MMRGSTLVELMVVLLILGLVTGLASFAVGALRSPAESERAKEMSRARAAAIRSGKALSVPAESGAVIRFLPDGRAIGHGVDPLTGELFDAKR